jgi:hypothetical protein
VTLVELVECRGVAARIASDESLVTFFHRSRGIALLGPLLQLRKGFLVAFVTYCQLGMHALADFPRTTGAWSRPGPRPQDHPLFRVHHVVAVYMSNGGPSQDLTVWVTPYPPPPRPGSMN